MAINFPNAPTNGQLYTDLTSGNIYIWNSTYSVWRIFNQAANTLNSIAVAAFTKANGAAQLSFVTVAANGTNLVAASNNDTLTLAATSNISIVGNAGTDTATFDLRNTGVTASVYGGASAVPVITVDAKGRLTSVSNTSISSGMSTGRAIAMVILFG